MRPRRTNTRRAQNKNVLLFSGVLGAAVYSIVAAVRALHARAKKARDAYRVPDYSKQKIGFVHLAMRTREKAAWTLLGTFVLMTVTHSLHLDRYFQTSILTAQEKNEVVREAKERLDVPYRLGETGPDYFDCSGFTKTVLEAALGIDSLPRTSRDMYASVGRKIDKDDLGVGDLVFFDTFGKGYVTHVGIVIDSDGRFANANSYYGKTKIDSLNEKYWRDTWIGARELTEDDGLSSEDRTPVQLAAADELTETVYDTIGFPPSELADPRLDADNFVAAETADPVIEREVVASDVITVPSDMASEFAPVSTDAIANTSTVTTTITELAETDEVPLVQLFADVPTDSPHYAATKFLKEQGIASGYDDNSFQPDRPISRVELMKLAFKTFDIRPSDAGVNFPDVPETHWGIGYMRAAVERQIVSGYPDGMFRPDQIVNKVEALKILFKAGALPTAQYQAGLFADVAADAWYAPYVQAAVDHGLVVRTASPFEPEHGMTRGAVAQFIYELLKTKTE